MTTAQPTLQTTEQLHRQFLPLIPKIETHARIVFRSVRSAVRKEDIIQECVALAWRWFLRLHERGKDIRKFIAAFIRLVAKAVRSGRRLVGMARAKDVLNERCQRKHGFRVEQLTDAQIPFDTLFSKPRGQEMQDAFEERLQDNHMTPVPDQVAFRVDWPQFFTSLTTRDQQMAEFLSLGHAAKHASEKFGLSPGRVSQLRQRWCSDWQRFQEADVLA